MKSSTVSLQGTTMMRKLDKRAAQASTVNVSRMCLKASKPTGPVSACFILGEGVPLIWPKRVCTTEQGMVFRVCFQRMQFPYLYLFSGLSRISVCNGRL